MPQNEEGGTADGPSRRGVRGRLSRSWRSLSRSLTNVNRGNDTNGDQDKAGQSMMAERVAARKREAKKASSRQDKNATAAVGRAASPVRLEGENMPPPASASASASASATVSATNTAHTPATATATGRKTKAPGSTSAPAAATAQQAPQPSKARGRSRSRREKDGPVLHVATDQPPRTRSSSAGRLRRSLSRSLSNLRDRARRARSRSTGRRHDDSNEQGHSGPVDVDGPSVRGRGRSPSPGVRVPRPLPVTKGALPLDGFGSPHGMAATAPPGSPARSVSSMDATLDGYSTRLPRSGSPVRSVVTVTGANTSAEMATRGRRHTFSHAEPQMVSSTWTSSQASGSVVVQTAAQQQQQQPGQGASVQYVEIGGDGDKREQELGPLPMGWDMCVDENGNEYFVK